MKKQKNMDLLLKKMKTEYESPVKYFLASENDFLCVNDFLGKKIKIEFTGEINCLKCGAKTNKSFAQGFCYKCFLTAPETEECVFNPEKCLAHQGIARDMEVAKRRCLRPNYVYLSQTSNVKVGVTNETQIPIRWIDQGAGKAIKLAKTPYRQLAGEIEVFLKQYFLDKTSWQKMLKNVFDGEDLLSAKKRAVNLLPTDLKKFVVKDNKIWEIEFPLLEIPQKIKSLKLDKTPLIKGTLTGIKGQYLIFDNQFVFNVRSHGGYLIRYDTI